jgi:hypothetical protein
MSDRELHNNFGLRNKFIVRKILKTGGRGAPLTDVFVLRPEKDPVALEALIRYAELTGNVFLHDDLWRWIERIKDADNDH